MQPTEANVARVMTDSDGESDDLDVIPAEDITVAIFCALPYESAAVKYTFDKELECRPKTIGPRKYVYSFGVIGEHNVVVARPSQMGTVKAAQCAATVSQQFPNVRFALLVGIGAGIPCFPATGSKRDIRLGDIAVSIPRDGHPGVVEYDYGKYEADGTFVLKGSLDKPHPILISADGALQEDEIMSKNRFWKTLKRIIEKAGYARPKSDDILFDESFRHAEGDGCSECLKCDDNKIIIRDIKPAEPVVHRGLILSGSGVVKNPEDRLRLRRGHTDAICFEMEAAGIVDEIPCLVVRGICDYADTHKQDGWHYYAAAVAAAYGKALLLKIHGEDLQEAESMKDSMSKISEDVRKTAAAVTRMESTAVKDKDKEILDWLTPMPINYGSQYSDLLKARQPGTGQWLLDSEQYQTWVGTKKQTLFCPGIPGAGKTILTSIVIEDLFFRFESVQEVGIAYLYCNFQRQSEQQTDNLLASLLQQLAQALPSLPSSVKSLYEGHNNKRTRPSLDEISRTLQSVATMYSRVFIVVDALDECQESDSGRSKLLSELSSLQAKCGINVFATSRLILGTIKQISEKFHGIKTLEIIASDEDVGRYLDGVMSGLPTFVGRDPALQEEIKSEITKAISGMHVFLLAKLYLDSLKGKTSAKGIRIALAKLGTGSQAYDYAYDDVMERIKGQFDDETKLAIRVLSWIVNAKRPLTTSELQYALAVEVDEVKLDTDNFPDVKLMVSVCAGLVTVDEKSSIIRLVHYTTQEYFERTQEVWFPNAQDDITEICVTYLSLSVFGSGFCQTEAEFDERLRVNHFYAYAAQNWGHHARKASTCCPMVISYLRDASKVGVSSQAFIGTGNRGVSDRPRPLPMPIPKVTGLHLAAYFGLQEAVGILLQDWRSIDQKENFGQTPLTLAAANGHAAVVKLLLATNGHTAVVKLLLATDKVNVNAKDSSGQTPLSRAAENGHEAVVKLLLATDKVGVDAKDDDGLTPLMYAAGNGHEAVAKLLLVTNKVDVDARDRSERTPLSYAAKNGHVAIVKLLLATNKVDVDAKDSYGQTPLLRAAENGHVTVIKLLLATDKVNVDIKNIGGCTPLLFAAWDGHEAVVKLLITTNKVNVDIKGDDGRTPLSHAAENGHEAVVKLLLATDKVDTDAKDNCGWPPLLYAARNGHEAVVKLLLGTDKVVVGGKDNCGWPPLLYAAMNGHKAVVKLLLATENVDIDAKNNGSSKPLLYAAENGHEAVVKLLLTTEKFDNNAKDINGLTPLLHAAWDGHNAIVKLLLATDKVDVDAKDNCGRTSLSRAARNGHEAVVKLLLATDKVDVNAKDDNGLTPLMYAASNGHKAVIKLLLATDNVNADTKNNFGKTPLSYAAENGHKAVVKLLLATHKVEANAKDNCGRTPLLYTAANGHEAVVKLLLAMDNVDVNVKSGDGRTPFSRAAENGHEAVVKLLLATDKVDIDAKDDDGLTPLMWAASNGHEAVVKLLLATDKVDADAKDNFGWTPLMWATRIGHDVIAKLLNFNISTYKHYGCRVVQVGIFGPSQKVKGFSRGAPDVVIFRISSGQHTAFYSISTQQQWSQ
ncbi:Ankyrin repeat-containing domain protein [Akanthomyces lecanii RCEF 1005]|uniref:Ankyrin repeat-containing domain protein n=1 Tax=Akanthomyces lecanii RCEF 1005 TaxID=1081108 RepID=A0A168EW90_CORDF|nr:Ankyrin repeat-containing domain protein [Akanthomyces lecanii RCEF 1005]